MPTQGRGESINGRLMRLRREKGHEVSCPCELSVCSLLSRAVRVPIDMQVFQFYPLRETFVAFLSYGPAEGYVLAS
jgi:hypothetical protein